MAVEYDYVTEITLKSGATIWFNVKEESIAFRNLGVLRQRFHTVFEDNRPDDWTQTLTGLDPDEVAAVVTSRRPRVHFVDGGADHIRTTVAGK